RAQRPVRRDGCASRRALGAMRRVCVSRASRRALGAMRRVCVSRHRHLPREPDSRVDEGVQDVHDQVDPDDHEARHHHDALLERVSLNIEAAKYHPSASDGMTTCRQSPAPEVGSHRSQTENTRISTSPSQKPGIERPSSATPFARVSHQVFTFTAEMMPAGTPTRMEIRVATRPSVKEFGSRWKYSSLTGSR